MSVLHQLTIAQWAARASEWSDADSWQAWANGDTPQPPAGSDTIQLPQVPAMLRRRLSPLGRAALWALFELRAQESESTPPPLATIFCSRHGEVSRTVTLLDDLATDTALSPTAFSLSVHNAIGGIYSMAANETGNITALSAGPDSLCHALLEAWCLLQDGTDQDRVLCVVYDDALPPPYPAENSAGATVQALALEVRKAGTPGTQLRFSLDSNPGDAASTSVNDDFLRLLLNPEHPDLTVSADQRRWHWSGTV